jgi:hypothetical protein
VINLDDIGLSSPSLFKVLLLSLFLLSLAKCLVLLQIKLLSSIFLENPFPFTIFFLIRLCHLFHNICFKGHSKGVGFSFSQLVFLFCPYP